MSVEDNSKSGLGVVEFARETQREISKVTWPTRKETVVTTIAIVVMALVASVFFFGIDALLGFIVTHILGMSA